MLDDPADFMPFACEVLRTVAPLARDLDSLVSALTDKRLLIVMDNCEHVIPQTAELARHLIEAAPQVRVIATSREPLRVKGGSTHRLGSLTLEDAVELFTERARAGGIWLGDERRAIIAAIVQQLDSIPLAIELAAPQLRNMSPEELLRRLDDRLQVLGMSNRGAPSRQQTLEALLDWSHRLLDENARKLFRRMAVFTGGCTLEAAMHVCGDEEELNEAVVGESLADLVFQIARVRRVGVVGNALPHARDHAHLRAGPAGRFERVRRGSLRARALLYDARAAIRRHA